MKVSEAIEKLKKLDGDSILCISDIIDNTLMEHTEVEKIITIQDEHYISTHGDCSNGNVVGFIS